MLAPNLSVRGCAGPVRFLTAAFVLLGLCIGSGCGNGSTTSPAGAPDSAAVKPDHGGAAAGPNKPSGGGAAGNPNRRMPK